MKHNCPTGRHREPHYSCYHGHGCRCPGCKDAAVADNRRRRRDRAYGRWRARTADAMAARALLIALFDAGATRTWISEQTGLDEGNLWAIRTGRRVRVHTSTLAKLRSLHEACGEGLLPPRAQEAAVDRCANHPECEGSGRRDGTHQLCRSCARALQEVS